MKVTITSTGKIVRLRAGTEAINARIWEGETETGIPVHCYVTFICPSIPVPDLTPDVEAQFASELIECRAPSKEVDTIPRRMVM